MNGNLTSKQVSKWFFDGAHFDVSRLTLAFKLLREEWQ